MIERRMSADNILTGEIRSSIQTNLLGIQYVYGTYLNNLPNITPYQQESETLAIEVSELDRKLQELDRIEEVYDREFIDRKKNPSSFGLLSKVGLQTTQDWVLAFFFLSYIIFSILFIVMIVMGAEKKMKGLIFAFCVTGVSGVLITLMISRYA